MAQESGAVADGVGVERGHGGMKAEEGIAPAIGIGAFEARELIRAMGGRLEVESREELGTRFRVLLPLAGAAGLIRSFQSPKSEVA